MSHLQKEKGKRRRVTATTITALISVALVIGAATVLAFSNTVQEVHAQGPPAKAQAILAAEPSERGAVASGDHGKPCTVCE